MRAGGERGVQSPHIGGSEIGAGRAAKWTDWMNRALVRQVLATDPINCERGRIVAEWAEVAKFFVGWNRSLFSGVQSLAISE